MKRKRKQSKAAYGRVCLLTYLILAVLVLRQVPLKRDLHKRALCHGDETGSINMKIWVGMHAWDEPGLLERAVRSVLSQKLTDGRHRVVLDVRLVVFVDRCGADANVVTRKLCRRNKRCNIIGALDRDTCPEQGSAFAKWEIINHVRRQADPHDYFTLLDGDDKYTSRSTLMNIFLGVLLPTRPNFAWGSQTGKFNEECKESHMPGTYARALVPWVFCHPRFFRVRLLSDLNVSMFKRSNGSWLQKATDRPLVYAALETSPEKITHIRGGPHVSYTFGKKNGLKRFSKHIISGDKQQVMARLPLKSWPLEIHLFCAIFDRPNTIYFMDHLLQSELGEYKVRVHIANNKASRQAELVALAALKSTDQITFDVTAMPSNLGGMARFLLLKQMMRVYLIDFAVFIDDDQYVGKQSILNLWAQRENRAMVSWFGKCWDNAESKYWVPTFGFNQIHQNSSFPKVWHYAGTGFSIVDTLIFSDPRVFQIPDEYFYVEDLWLSYILSVNTWKRKRAFVSITQSNESHSGQFNNLKKVKERMFRQLNTCPTPFIEYSKHRVCDVPLMSGK